MTWSYVGYHRIAGPLRLPAQPSVAYRPVVSGRQRIVLASLIALTALTHVAFIGWLLLPAHRPSEQLARGALAGAIGFAGYAGIVSLELIRAIQNATTWLFAWRMRDPLPLAPVSGLRVAVLTTIVPSKEPLDVLRRSLAAMRRLRYDGVVDVWVLDEGDDPEVKRLAAELGVRHFSRKGKPEYNQDAGEFRARTKAGNHNAWRAEHEDSYDVVAQMDPDHCPLPEFLQRTLGYFRDPDVAFVVAPQVYGNGAAPFVARGAAAQSFLFHGVVQRGANGMDAPLLIGTNHLYRPRAWKQIGGYRDSIIEDHLTSLHVHASTNPKTGRRWKGVYTPDVVAIGEGPERWSDYFNQQRRWAHGVWDVALRHSRRLFPALSWPQRLSYASLQWFYPSVGAIWVIGTFLTAIYLLGGIDSIYLAPAVWGAFWGATFLMQTALVAWLMRFDLAAHERSFRLLLEGNLLSLAAGPVYAVAGLNALFRRPLRYVVTGKGRFASRDSLRIFEIHLRWLAFVVAALLASVVLGHDYWILRGWAYFLIVALVTPMVLFVVQRRREHRLLWRARGADLTPEYFRPLPANLASQLRPASQT